MSDIEAAFRPGTKVHGVFLVLRDCQWHCRECEYRQVEITQIAGGAGIQGLQRGTRSRPGMEIESGDHLCVSCKRMTRHDRWTGSLKEAVPAPSMPASFAKRAIQVLGSRDIVDNTERMANQLTVDHKLPTLRWTPETEREQNAYTTMTDDDIRAKFQLLRKSNGSISHNLLKSRACERCFKTGKRGTPFGIVFFYEGDARWGPGDKTDPRGCVGCGWFDMSEWRKRLNSVLRKQREPK